MDTRTRNQKRKYNRDLRREERRQKNISKQEIEQQTSGKLIEENHNGLDYSPEFTSKAVSWYLGLLYMKMIKYKNNPEKFGIFFSKVCREKLQTLLLHWSTKRVRDWSFWFILNLLDVYREKKENSYTKLLELCKKKFSERIVDTKVYLDQK